MAILLVIKGIGFESIFRQVVELLHEEGIGPRVCITHIRI